MQPRQPEQTEQTVKQHTVDRHDELFLRNFAIVIHNALMTVADAKQRLTAINNELLEASRKAFGTSFLAQLQNESAVSH